MSGLDGLVKIGAAGLLVYGVYMGVNAGDVVATLGDAAQQAQGVVEQVDLEGESDYTILEVPEEGAEAWSSESGYGEGEPEVFARIGDEAEAPVDAPSAIQNSAVEDVDCGCDDADGESEEDCDDEDVDDADAREEDEPDCDDDSSDS